MHPAFSVIFFTTFSGAGYGLAIVLCLGLGDASLLSTKIAWFLALAFISGGLLSSTLHLGNPQRAWRAFSQWRSSWLSREGVLAVLTFIPLTILAFLAIFFGEFMPWLGIVGAVMCLATVYCTAMIYASLRTIAAWHTGLTPVCYVAFSLASGAVLFAAITGQTGAWYLIIAVALVAIAWAVKWQWKQHADTAGTGSSSIASATGLGHLGKVRLLERPHMTENYLTREMGFRVARKHAEKLWMFALFFGLALPGIFLLAAAILPNTAIASVLTVIGAISLITGILTERWLFFATAKHAMSLYYNGAGD